MKPLHPLCSVRTLKTPIVEGSILAANGDWNRKYLVVMRDGALHAKFLGRFYADGREQPARRVSVFRLTSFDDLSKAIGKGGCQYWHVSSARSAA